MHVCALRPEQNSIQVGHVELCSRQYGKHPSFDCSVSPLLLINARSGRGKSTCFMYAVRSPIKDDSVGHLPISRALPVSLLFLRHTFSFAPVFVNMHPYLLVTTLVLAHILIIGASPWSPTSSSYAVKESHDVPSQWVLVDKPPQHQTIDSHLALRQSRFGKLETILLEGTFFPCGRKYPS